jgi:hypothetical protein
MFGQPSRTSIQDGRETLTYTYTNFGAEYNPLQFVPCIGLCFMGGKTQTENQLLTVTITDNIVTDYSYSEGGETGSIKYF